MTTVKKNKHAVALGRLAAGKTSERKKLSSAANGKLGGRPPFLTDLKIKTLRAEAAVAGDLAMVTLCHKALAGSRRARAACARVIADAQAQETA